MQINTSINTLPCSKSYANRAIVYSYVMGLENEIHNLSNSEDIQNTLKAIESLNNKDSDIDLGEGGTTIRFMLCVLALEEREITVKVHPRFKMRPIEELFNYLRTLGATVISSNKEDILCTIKGPLKRDMSLEVDCTKTSQFASGLLLISEKINLKLSFKNFTHSRSYFDLTKKVISDLKNTKEVVVPTDSSSSVYFIIFAVLNKNIRFSQILSRDSSQADDKLFDVLKLINANYEFTKEGLNVYQTNSLTSFNFDVSECLDLSMALVYLACFIEGTSHISGIKNLKYKEVDRIKAITSILDSIGTSYSLLENSISIQGNTQSNDFNISPMADHRAVMVSSLLLKSINKSTDVNKECVNKSFPNFFKILLSL